MPELADRIEPCSVHITQPCKNVSEGVVKTASHRLGDGGWCVPADVQAVFADVIRSRFYFAKEDVSFQTVCEGVPAHKMHHAWGQSGLFLALANHGRFEAFILLNSATG